MGANNDKALYI
jgi:thioesterase domain-containing protein